MDGDVQAFLDEIGSERSFETKFATMNQMLDGWIGVGRSTITAPVRETYQRFVERCDTLGLWEANVDDAEVRSRLLVGDLGTIMDLDLIAAFAGESSERTFVLEVGGGYGRLAEAALNVFGDSVFYVLVDSVPGSLYYAKSYLQAACPERRIGSYYDGDDFDPERFDCKVVPSWRFEELNGESRVYDVLINIESFQEMSQVHVDYYLGLFDRVGVDGATIYVSNSHEYLFKGSWNYPSNWQKVFCANTPRSFVLNHPTEIFAKGSSDFSEANAAVDAAYLFANEPADVEKYLSIVGARAAIGPVARFIGRRSVDRVRDTFRRSR
jgi:hypothetical protein